MPEQPDVITQSDELIVTRGLFESTTGVLWCGNNESLMAENADCKWPMSRVTTCHRLSGLSPLAADDEHRAWLAAIAIWNAACGIQLVWTEDFNSANIYAAPGSMSSGILAWSYLPCGSSSGSQLEQQYNQSVSWSYALLLDTMIHEIGHALGLPHSNSNGDIMRPFSNGQMGKLGAGDIAEVRRRYGLPKPVDPETPTPPSDLQTQINEIRTQQILHDAYIKSLLKRTIGLA